MPNYMLMYHGGKTPESPEEGEEHMVEWETWVVVHWLFEVIL